MGKRGRFRQNGRLSPLWALWPGAPQGAAGHVDADSILHRPGGGSGRRGERSWDWQQARFGRWYRKRSAAGTGPGRQVGQVRVLITGPTARMTEEKDDRDSVVCLGAGGDSSVDPQFFCKRAEEDSCLPVPGSQLW